MADLRRTEGQPKEEVGGHWRIAVLDKGTPAAQQHRSNIPRGQIRKKLFRQLNVGTCGGVKIPEIFISRKMQTRAGANGEALFTEADKSVAALFMVRHHTLSGQKCPQLGDDVSCLAAGPIDAKLG